MNNRNGLIAAGVIAVIAVIFAMIQSGNLSQTESKLSAAQNTATVQQAAFANQGTAAAATLSAASTQAADTQQKAVSDAANAAATTQANSLADASKAAATAQAKALGDAANVASTMQAQILAAASEAAATEETNARKEVANAAATAQANALNDAANSAATAQANAVSDAKNADATRQSQNIATLKAGATATLGAVVNADATHQAEAVADTLDADATTQAQAIGTVQAHATATISAVIIQAATDRADTQMQYHITEVAVQTQIAEINAELAIAQANAASPVSPTAAATGQATGISPIKPTAESTEQSSDVPADWKRYVGKGVAIQLPKTFIGSELGSDPQALGKLLRSLGPDFESAAALLESNPEILSFIAVNQGDGDKNLAASVIIVSIPLPTAIPINTLLEATINQLPKGSKVLEKGVVQLGEYEAGRMIIETHVGTIVSTQLQYYIIANNTLYLVGFTGTPDHFEAQLPSFEQSMKTFEILAKPGI